MPKMFYPVQNNASGCIHTCVAHNIYVFHEVRESFTHHSTSPRLQIYFSFMTFKKIAVLYASLRVKFSVQTVTKMGKIPRIVKLSKCDTTQGMYGLYPFTPESSSDTVFQFKI